MAQALTLGILLWGGHPNPLSWVFFLEPIRTAMGYLHLRDIQVWSPALARGRGLFVGLQCFLFYPGRSPWDQEKEVWGTDSWPWYHTPMPGPSLGPPSSWLANSRPPFQDSAGSSSMDTHSGEPWPKNQETWVSRSDAISWGVTQSNH